MYYQSIYCYTFVQARYKMLDLFWIVFVEFLQIYNKLLSLIVEIWQKILKHALFLLTWNYVHIETTVKVALRTI